MKLKTYDDVLDYKLQARFFFGRAILSLFLVLGLHTQLFGQDGTWINTTTASVGWSTAAAWLNSIIAGGAGSTATITANQTTNQQINLVTTGTTTIGVINIGDPDGSNGYTLSGGAGSSLTFDNNNATGQFNVISGSGTVTLAAGAQSIVLNDNLVISQSSGSLLTWATPTKGGSGTDVKIIEHVGSGSGGVTISGVIADGAAGTGTVSVRQNNSNGTMTLSGNNTYTGGTTVDAGTLALGAASRLSNTGALTINGGTFDMKTFSDTVGAVAVNGGLLSNGTLTGSSYAVTGGTISAVLAGTGVALTKTGTGTTVLSGANSYTGGTFLNEGVLSVSSKANFANRLLTFDGGTLEATASFSDLTSANATTLNAGGGTIRIGAGLANSWGSAAISGAGGLTKEGDGVLTLAANNSYTGGTVINGGTLSIDTSARINANNGGLTFNGGTLRTTGTLGFTKSTTLLAGGGTFEVADGTINTWNSAISGDGQLTKTGAGQLNLTAANAYRGDTLIKSGTLLVGSAAAIASSSSTFVDGGLLKVNGTAGAVTVNTGGSLGGAGTVGALTLNSGGLLNPGNSPGTLTAASAIVLGGSTYNWQITSLAGTAGTNWDLLSVSGLLDMSGVTSSSKWNLVITADSGFAGWTGTSSYSYVFAQAASVSGFSSVAGTDVTSLFNITTSGISNLPNSSSTPAGEFKVTVESVGGLTTLNLMAVPEPSAASLMAIGLASLIILRRFRRRQS